MSLESIDCEKIILVYIGYIYCLILYPQLPTTTKSCQMASKLLTRRMVIKLSYLLIALWEEATAIAAHGDPHV